MSSTDAKFGSLAVIDADCVLRMTGGRTDLRTEPFVRVVVHEIGLLVLGPGGHGSSGLMRAERTEAEWIHIAAGRLRFNREDAVRLRKGLAAREAAVLAWAR